MLLTAADIRLLESIPPSAFSALLKSDSKKKKKKKSLDKPKIDESARILESAGVLSATEAETDAADNTKITKGPILKVWLLTEGLGNKRDKNYYGRECIESGPQIFEGSVMNLNHLGYIEEQNRPEGDVEKQVAYYRNCKAERVNTPEGLKYALTAEACFDGTIEGMNAYQKAKNAIHFREDFPASDKEYVGISVNAFGESEPRRMMVDGREMEVNYVMRFAEGSRGADMVTLPARGGSFRALVEDIYGAQPTKEVKMKKLLEALESAQTKLKEAMALKEADKRQEKTLEAQKELEVAVNAIKEAAVLTPSGEADDTTEGAITHDSDDDDCACKACESAVAAARKRVKPGKEAVTKEAKALEAERREVQTVAVEKLIEATGIDKKYFDMPSLVSMSFREAKADIDKQKRMHESAVATVMAKVSTDVSASHRARESADGTGTGGNKAPNNAEFPLLSVAQ